MATQLFALARTAGRMRHQVLALSGAAVAAACYTMPDEQYMPRLPSMVPVAYADVNSTTATATPKKVSIESKTTPNASIALSGFEDVKDANGFVSAALDKTLKHAADSPLQTLISNTDPATFFSLLEKQPLTQKMLLLDDIVDSVIKEAERSAEVSGLTVGMVGGGVACYALLGWYTDLAMPGAGTLACSAVAGAAGHNRAKAAARKTRTRFLNAIMASSPTSSNSFVAYLAAPTTDVKAQIASATKPAAFFNDFFTAVQPLLKQVRTGADAVELVNEIAA